MKVKAPIIVDGERYVPMPDFGEDSCIGCAFDAKGLAGTGPWCNGCPQSGTIYGTGLRAEVAYAAMLKEQGK